MSRTPWIQGLLAASLCSGAALAQPGRPPLAPPPPPPSVAPPDGDLGRLFGLRVQERLLSSTDPDERLRGVQRIAADPSPGALDLLLRSQEPGSLASRDLRARLEAIRALGPHLAQDAARQVVVRALVDGAALPPGATSDLAALLRDTAAMVLGHHGGPRGTDALAGLLRQGGVAASSAALALQAHPPERLDSLLGNKAPASVELVRVIIDLGELRAIPQLRQALRGGDPEVRAASLVALAELGDGEAPLVARQWVKETEVLPRVAAIRALLRSSPVEGRGALAALLKEPGLVKEGLTLALEGPGPELVEPLVALLRGGLAGEQRSQAIEALGRCGGDAAAGALASMLGGAGGHEAGLALALAPGEGARRALEKALREGALRAVAVRASTIRALVLRERPSGLWDAVEAAWKGSAAERGAAAFSWVALGKRSVEEKELQGADVVGSAARGALARGAEGLESLLRVLESDPGAERGRREALVSGLLARHDGGKVPTRVLESWVEEGGASAPLAARALAVRDDEETLGRLGRLLGSGAPALRSHVALGLGRSPRPDAAGRLVDAYTFETEAGVRRAIVRALSWRREPQRERVLRLAAALDPDRGTRALARQALRGLPAPERTGGDLVAWIQVDGAAGATALRWERPDGLVVPVVTDGDGALLVPGLPAAASHVVAP